MSKTKVCFCTLICVFVLGLADPELSRALINDSDRLDIGSSETLTLSGTCSYAKEVRIHDGGILWVAPYDGTTSTGQLALQAPLIQIGKDSKIEATGSGYRGGAAGLHPRETGLAGEGPGGGQGGDYYYSEGWPIEEGNGDTNGKSGAYQYGTSSGMDLEMGSGGGGGGYYFISWLKFHQSSPGCKGGNGGGLIALKGSCLQLEGQIRADGADSDSYTYWQGYPVGDNVVHKNGGTGSGGGVLLEAALVSIGPDGLISATSPGGSAADGRVKIFSSFVSSAGAIQCASQHVAGATLTLNAPANYHLGLLQEGSLVYGDRAYAFAAPLPAELANQPYIQTLNGDKDTTSSAPSFTVGQPVRVIVALSEAITAPPQWLLGWMKRSDRLTTTDAVAGRILYEKRFDAGQVTLGANHETGMPAGGSMYSIIIVPAVNGVRDWETYE